MLEEKFTPEESLRVIRSMIEKSREDMRGNDAYFLLWGWLTFAAFTAQFILKHVLEYPRHYMVWWIVPVGIAGTIFLRTRDRRKQSAKTYIGESMRYLWMGMGISFFVLSMIISNIGWHNTVFPFFILLYGLGTFISGGLLRFKPFMIGGIVAWILAVDSVFLSYDYQMLCGALAILASYLIPAYLLRVKIKKDNIVQRA